MENADEISWNEEIYDREIAQKVAEAMARRWIQEGDDFRPFEIPANMIQGRRYIEIDAPGIDIAGFLCGRYNAVDCQTPEEYKAVKSEDEHDAVYYDKDKGIVKYYEREYGEEYTFRYGTKRIPKKELEFLADTIADGIIDNHIEFTVSKYKSDVL